MKISLCAIRVFNPGFVVSMELDPKKDFFYSKMFTRVLELKYSFETLRCRILGKWHPRYHTWVSRTAVLPSIQEVRMSFFSHA